MWSSFFSIPLLISFVAVLAVCQLSHTNCKCASRMVQLASYWIVPSSATSFSEGSRFLKVQHTPASHSQSRPDASSKQRNWSTCGEQECAALPLPWGDDTMKWTKLPSACELFLCAWLDVWTNQVAAAAAAAAVAVKRSRCTSLNAPLKLVTGQVSLHKYMLRSWCPFYTSPRYWEPYILWISYSFKSNYFYQYMSIFHLFVFFRPCSTL